jgi:hypothetical protein
MDRSKTLLLATVALLVPALGPHSERSRDDLLLPAGSGTVRGPAGPAADHSLRQTCQLALDEVLSKEQVEFLSKTFRGRTAIDEIARRLPPEIQRRYQVERDGAGTIVLRIKDAPLLPVSRRLLENHDLVASAEGLVRLARDPRSKIPGDVNYEAASAIAADAAYDIRDDRAFSEERPATVDVARLERRLSDYRVVQVYADALTGFKALALEYEASGAGAHRIYAAAGTETFENTDFRDWGTGLGLGRAQFSSDAALLLARDAAAYAAAEDGGEVVVTGQSLGGLLAQGISFNIQSLLNARGAEHRLIHTVTWGGTGAGEAITFMLNRARNDGDRGVGADIEAHRIAVVPEARRARRVWDELREYWEPRAADRDFVAGVFAQTDFKGFYFTTDYFARVGTFFGKRFAFPVHYAIPTECEGIRLRNITGVDVGNLGFILESHFLVGYHRALARGALREAVVRDPKRWEWVLALQRRLEFAGRAWLRNIYLGKLARSADNWEACYRSGRWKTNQNIRCRDRHWPGCSPGEPGGETFCLIVP